MRTRRSPPEPFRFLDLPAGKLPRPQNPIARKLTTIGELRNSIYELVTAEDKGRVRRFAQRRNAAKTSPPTGNSTPASIFPLAHVCQSLRNEFLSHLFVTFEVGVEWRDVKYFCRTVCCTSSKGELRSVRAPKSVTVYIDEHVCTEAPSTKPSTVLRTAAQIAAQKAKDRRGIVEVPKVLRPSLDILPLLKLRLLREDYVCSFVLDTKVDWVAVKERHTTWRAQGNERVAAAVQDLARFMVFGSEPWARCVGEQLDKVLVHPWTDWGALHIELVFKQQPSGSMNVDSKTRRCYMPDLRRAGLQHFYATTGLHSCQKAS